MSIFMINWQKLVILPYFAINGLLKSQKFWKMGEKRIIFGVLEPVYYISQVLRRIISFGSSEKMQLPWRKSLFKGEIVFQFYSTGPLKHQKILKIA